MIFSFIFAFIVLIGLLVLHEFSHFILAKKFGVKVEEFGVGYPPRIWGKKFGETLYSINLLPFGAFVRLPNDEASKSDSENFRGKSFWQKFFVITGGVISFWLIAAVLFSIVMGLGVPTAIGDEENHNLVNPKVQIAYIAKNSPAEKAKLAIGDAVINFKYQNSDLKITKVKEFQDLTNRHRGEEIILKVQRGKEIFDVSLVPRLSPPADEGPIGVALVRTAMVSYPWYRAPLEGIKITGILTIETLKGWGQALGNLVKRQPTGVQLMGPVGIFDLFAKASQLGISYFLQFIAIISVYMALFNILPIPMTDGGRLLFVLIGKIKGRPIKQEIEQGIDAAFFLLIIGLMIWVTIKDIARLF